MAQPAEPQPWLPGGFLALPEHLSDPAASRFLVLPVPYDATTSYKAGAREGPRAIIEASRQMEDFDQELGWEPCQWGIHTLPELEPHAAGPEAMLRRVEEAVLAVARPGRVVVTLGGEHSLSVGAVRAMASLYPDISVLFLDAHADMRAEFQGTPYSHACTARRISEVCPIVLAGTRSMAREEHAFMAERKVPSFPWGPGARAQEVAEGVCGLLGPRVYVTVDLDVLDPGVMAAVGTPEPGGMGWGDLLAILRAVAARRQVVGLDLMELAPAQGPPACAYTAARLAYKAMGYVAGPPPGHGG